MWLDADHPTPTAARARDWGPCYATAPPLLKNFCAFVCVIIISNISPFWKISFCSEGVRGFGKRNRTRGELEHLPWHHWCIRSMALCRRVRPVLLRAPAARRLLSIAPALDDSGPESLLPRSLPRVTLFRFDPQRGSPYGDKSVSPFGLKVETFLRLSGIAYETPPFEAQLLTRSSTRKLPFADIGGRLVPDSSFILEHLTRAQPYREQIARSLCDARLSPQQRAVGISAKLMCEESLYFNICYWRYKWEPGFRRYVEINPVLHEAPALLRGVLARASLRMASTQLWEQGTGRYSEEEVYMLGRQMIDALAALLPAEDASATGAGAGDFLFGAEPSSFDATLFAFVSGIVEIDIPSPLKRYVLEKHPRLLRYLDVVNERCKWPVGKR
jgi:glutathione S-transferase